MGRRTIAILIFIVGIIMLSIVGVLFILQQDQPPPPAATPGPGTAGPGEVGEPGTTPEVVEATLPAMVEVVVSLQTVPRGWQMTEAELTTDMRVADEVDSNVITNIEDALGLYARTDIYQGQTLTTDMLARDPTLIGVENYGPSSLIPSGFVAQAIPMDRLSSVAYGISEGDYIDILIRWTFLELDPEFQTILQNSATIFLEVTDEEGNTQRTIFLIDPLGRFETLATGDMAHISPSEDQRPVSVAMVLQNARVIQVGPWEPVPPAQPATPTPEPVAEGEETPTPGPGQVATATPRPPDVLLVALNPQQQLLLKYAVEARADIDFALRGLNDGQLYSVENVDFNYLLQRFNIEIPPDFNYTVDVPGAPITATPPPATPQPVPEGGEGS